MVYYCNYNSTLGNLILKCNGEELIEICLPNNNQIDSTWSNDEKIEVLIKVKKWLDEYFNGDNPVIDFKIKLDGTEFQKEVWNILKTISYGKTTTYGEIAEKIAKKRGINKMPAQAVGNAVSKNPIPIIIPCHRVIGKDGSLVGYAGGLEIKKKLLIIENILSKECK